MKRNQELMKLTKYLCHALTLKDMDMCQMMEFIRWLIFINIVLKKIVITKIMTIEKDCDK